MTRRTRNRHPKRGRNGDGSWRRRARRRSGRNDRRGGRGRRARATGRGRESDPSPGDHPRRRRGGGEGGSPRARAPGMARGRGRGGRGRGGWCRSRGGLARNLRGERPAVALARELLDHLADREVGGEVLQAQAVGALQRVRAVLSDPAIYRISLVRATARRHEAGLSHQLLRDGTH